MKEKSTISKPKAANADMTLTAMSESLLSPLSSAIAACQAGSRKMTSTGKSISCVPSSRKQKSLKTSEATLTSREKDLKPFWNEQLTEISPRLWLPTETDLQDLDSSCTNGLSKDPAENSWFSTTLHYRPNENLQTTCSISCTSFPVECTDLEITKSKLVRLYPKKQKAIFESWIDASREIYNFILLDVLAKGLRPANWMALKKEMTGGWPEHLENVPFQIKGIAIKDACEAYKKTWNAYMQRRPGTPISFKPRSRKDAEQSCFIPKSAISEQGIYPTISGLGLKFSESLPDSFLDARLVRKSGRWFLALPHKVQRRSAESQGRVVALDPGVRNFVTFFSDNACGHIGQGDFSRIQRLAHHLDTLISSMSKAGKQKKMRMQKAADRMRHKIKDLVAELHHKAALFFVENFDVILLPTFETKNMVRKSGRKLRTKTVRNLLSFGYYKFKQFLKHKAFEFGKLVVDCSEAYTSKTHPETGEVRRIGGAKRIKTSRGWVDRDIVGGRNILLRSLVDHPDLVSAVNVC